MQQVWLPVFVDSIDSRSWPDDDNVVVYHGITGNTHLLDPLTVELLAMISEARHSTESLCRELSPAIADATPQEVAAAVDSALARLRDSGLIVSAPV